MSSSEVFQFTQELTKPGQAVGDALFAFCGKEFILAFECLSHRKRNRSQYDWLSERVFNNGKRFRMVQIDINRNSQRPTMVDVHAPKVSNLVSLSKREFDSEPVGRSSVSGIPALANTTTIAGYVLHEDDNFCLVASGGRWFEERKSGVVTYEDLRIIAYGVA